MVKRNTGDSTYYPLRATVSFEGNKKPDTLEAQFKRSDNVKEGDEIYYIQDVIDTRYLMGVYPMQLSCLDESGNNADPETDPPESRFTNVTEGKFKGMYALKFDAIHQGVWIWDNGVNGTQPSRIDLSKQFDINIWFTPDSDQFYEGNDEPVIWSFVDRQGNNRRGLEIGIKGNTGGSWHPWIKVYNGDYLEEYTGTTTSINFGIANHIRVKRGQDDVLTVFGNGLRNFFRTIREDLQPSGVPMVFGDTVNDSDGNPSERAYKGLINEVKIYCGTDLTKREAERIRWTKPIIQYMKFGGRVKRIKDDQVSKNVFCNSHSYQLIKTRLGTVIQDNGFEFQHSIRTDLGFTSYKQILQEAINRSVDSSFNVRVLDPFEEQTTNSLTGNIIEVGLLTDFIDILLLFSDTTMYVTPRKNVIIETKSIPDENPLNIVGKFTNHVFDQNGQVIKYNIRNCESDDTKLANEAVLSGANGRVDVILTT